MNYLSVEAVSKTYGTKTLFNKVTFGINKGQRVALVAGNGAGKSSLLKIITGKEFPDEGAVSIRRTISVSYLDQDPVFDPDITVFDAIYYADSPLLQAVKDYEESLLAFEHNHSNSNTQKLQDATAAMDKLGAWDYETKIKEILSRFNVDFLDRKVSSLSGGQKKRVALASVLIHEPDLLILDEPTNHLDVQMIEWLEDYLIGRNLTLLLVTHDRYFLDRVCTEIIEIDHATLYSYKGNFSYYLEKKAEHEQSESSEIDKARNLYRRELEWVRRMPKARGTKSKARLDAFEDLQTKAQSKKKQEKLALDVKTTRMGGKILELIKISKAYDEFIILNSFSYVFKKNEKIGIVGKNGAGKTTLLNMVMGLEPTDTGKIQTGETIVFGYYSQDGLQLNEDKRVIEVVKDIAEFIPLADGTKLSASQLLQRFQFPPDVQYNYVSKLSGGEKRRLYLLTVLVKNPNFLILDEPTNDLDIVTLHVLEEFLMLFQGCMLIVSHDRYFMDKLVNHLFVFEGNGIIRDFPGNYSNYRQVLEEEETRKKIASTATRPTEKSFVQAATATTPPTRKPSYKEQKEFEQLEKEIAGLETEKTTLNNLLNSGSSKHEEVLQWSQRISEVMQQLDEKTMRWLELSERM